MTVTRMGLKPSHREKGACREDRTAQDTPYTNLRGDEGGSGVAWGWGGERLGNKGGVGEWLLMSTGFVLGSDRNVNCSKIRS